MTTATKTFDKKSIYNSDLVRASAGGGVMLKLTGEVRESKFPKPNTSHVAFLKFPDDEMEYSLAVENETLEMWQRAPQDVWMMAVATGSAKEAATIQFSQAPNTPVFHNEEDAVPQNGPPPMWPAEPQPAQDVITECVDNAVRTAKLFGSHGFEVEVGPLFATFFIQAHKR